VRLLRGDHRSHDSIEPTGIQGTGERKSNGGERAAEALTMAFQKILVPVDFSPSSSQAYSVARTLARTDGAELLIVHVIDSRDLELLAEVGSLKGDAVEKALHKRARLKLGAFLSTHPADVKCHRIIVIGSPFGEIIKISRKEKIDLIVMGRYGGTGELEKIFFGSTAEKVVRMAPCAVLSIPLIERIPRRNSS
jgi:nucleotide-binding universal stress UspA family protein